MIEPLSEDPMLGEGFAFFRWASSMYPYCSKHMSVWFNRVALDAWKEMQ